jgi:hypothetical protein
MFVSRLALLVLLLAGRTAWGVEPHGKKVNIRPYEFANAFDGPGIRNPKTPTSSTEPCLSAHPE